MPELDFSREPVPHVRGTTNRTYYSEGDLYTRLNLLPLLSTLDERQRMSFDKQFLDHFAPEIEQPSRFAAQVVMRQLPIEGLEQTTQMIQEILQ